MKNRQKGFASIIFIVLAVILVGAVGYFGFVKKSTQTQNQAVNNNEVVTKPLITLIKHSNGEIEFTFSAPKDTIQSKVYLNCESGLSAYFSDNITPRTPTPYPNICNTWQEDGRATVKSTPYIRDIKFINETTQGKVATLQMAVTMSNSSVIKSDLSSITIDPTQTTQDQTASWKTYQNSKYGYEIKYPSDAILTVVNDYGASGSHIVSAFSPNDSHIIIGIGNAFVSVCNNDCGSMGGLGVGSFALKESVVIDGKTYNATGYASNTPEDSQAISSINIPPLEIRYGYKSKYGKPMSTNQLIAIDKSIKAVLSTLKLNI